MSYSIGHLAAAEGDTVSPDGNYLVGLNKLSHGRHLNVGPSQPESSQLLDITEEKMKLLYDAFTEPEPHYAQIIKADKIKPIEVYPKEENKHPLAIWDVKDAGVTRSGKKVLVKMVAVRSTLTPTSFEVQRGRRGHGRDHQHRADDRRAPRLRPARLQHQPRDRSGRDQDVTFTAKKSGVFAVLLHELLLGAPPGDAGLPDRQDE